MQRILRRAKDKLKGATSKVAVVGTAVGVAASNASAAIVVDPATGVMSGTMDLAPFFGATVIAAGAIGTMLAVFLGIKALKKVA